MPLPSGVLTREVTFGPFVDFLGNPVRGHVIITPPCALLWAKSAVPIVPTGIQVDIDEFGTGLVRLPCTDQDGFVDQRGHQLRDWTYRAVFYIEGKTQFRPVTFSLPPGDGAIDLLSPN